MVQEAGFLACLCYYGNADRPNDYLLILSCFPLHLKSQVNSHISSRYTVNFYGEGTSGQPLSAGDQVFVSLSKRFSVKQNGNEEDFYLM